jgi:hypothetical protein
MVLRSSPGSGVDGRSLQPSGDADEASATLLLRRLQFETLILFDGRYGRDRRSPTLPTPGASNAGPHVDDLARKLAPGSGRGGEP